MFHLTPYKCQDIAESKVKMTSCERAPRLPASPSLITFFHVVHARHLALKGLIISDF